MIDSSKPPFQYFDWKLVIYSVEDFPGYPSSEALLTDREEHDRVGEEERKAEAAFDH